MFEPAFDKAVDFYRASLLFLELTNLGPALTVFPPSNSTTTFFYFYSTF